MSDRTIIYRCTECGYQSLNLGTLHGHAEKHRGYTRFNIQLPFTKTSLGDFDALMDYTEVIEVVETVEYDIDAAEVRA